MRQLGLLVAGRGSGFFQMLPTECSRPVKKILVTGGAGRLGRLVIDELLAHDYDVFAVDRVDAREMPCRFLPVELTDAAAVYDVLRGRDAVIHLAAVPGPTSQTQSATFGNNVSSTFHVAQAASALGLGKLVFASSVFTLGWAEPPERYWPRYVPVDEAHPLAPLEAYGLSKQVGEDICAAASRRSKMAAISLRIMNIIPADGYAALPAAPPTPETPVRFVMWPYVDARDAARACRLALEAPTAGHEAMFIAAEDIRFDSSTRRLLEDLAPESLEIRGPLPFQSSVISIEKAKDLIHFEPQYSWRTQSDQRDKPARPSTPQGA